MKLFLDLGAHEGQSLIAFSNWKGDSAREYDIYSFEANIEALPNLWNTRSKLIACGLKINIIPCLVGCSGMLASFDGWQLSEFGKDQYDKRRQCPVFDISFWLSSIIEKYSEIVVKMDIEGAEYFLIPQMASFGVLDKINELFVEIHGPKRGFSRADTQRLINLVYSYGVTPCVWEAQSGHSKYDLNTLRAVIIPDQIASDKSIAFYDHYYELKAF